MAEESRSLPAIAVARAAGNMAVTMRWSAISMIVAAVGLGAAFPFLVAIEASDVVGWVATVAFLELMCVLLPGRFGLRRWRLARQLQVASDTAATGSGVSWSLAKGLVTATGVDGAARPDLTFEVSKYLRASLSRS